MTEFHARNYQDKTFNFHKIKQIVSKFNVSSQEKKKAKETECDKHQKNRAITNSIAVTKKFSKQLHAMTTGGSSMEDRIIVVDKRCALYSFCSL